MVIEKEWDCVILDGDMQDIDETEDTELSDNYGFLLPWQTIDLSLVVDGFLPLSYAG